MYCTPKTLDNSTFFIFHYGVVKTCINQDPNIRIFQYALIGTNHFWEDVLPRCNTHALCMLHLYCPWNTLLPHATHVYCMIDTFWQLLTPTHLKSWIEERSNWFRDFRVPHENGNIDGGIVRFLWKLTKHKHNINIIVLKSLRLNWAKLGKSAIKSLT